MSSTSLSGPLYVDGVLVPNDGFPSPGRKFYLSAGGFNTTAVAQGSDSWDGTSWDRPFLTMERFLDDVRSFDTLYFIGDVREEALIGSNLAFDVRIVGNNTHHHPDVPSSSYHPAGSMIRPPASPTATTPTFNIRGRGWSFEGVSFDCPVDEYSIVGRVNALSGTSEYDASHLKLINCSFQQGLGALKDDGGMNNVLIYNTVMRLMTPTGACAIKNVSTSVRVPQYWNIIRLTCPGNGVSGGNEAHIDAPLSGCNIEQSLFGEVEGTGLYIDLTGGDSNSVHHNTLGGVYDTDDYVAGTADLWYQNAVAVVAVTAPDGVTLAAPAAP